MSAEEVQHQYQGKSDEPCHGGAAAKAEDQAAVEATDRGLFDFVGKKEEEKKCEGEVMASEFDEKVKVSDEKKHESLLEKHHRSGSSSSSSSDEEEVDENGEKKKKKKEKKKSDDKIEEKKSFLDKIKGKLPGGKKAAAEEVVASPPPTPAVADECATAPEAEKKGFLEKIKDKIPGYGSKNDEIKGKENEYTEK